MTAEEEKAWWLQMVTELRDVLTLERIAREVDVSVRTVCNWQNGERPMGMKAIRVYLLHMKHCKGLHRTPLQIAEPLQTADDSP